MPTNPKYRRPLNPKQLTILRLIFRYRFITTQLLAQTLHISLKIAHERLEVLLSQEYIGRQDAGGFRLPGQFAIYHLTPKGVAALPNLPENPRTKSLILRIGKDNARSDRFIQHCLGVYGIYCDLSAQFKEDLRFFTKSDLTAYHYFPTPLPDAYIRLGTGEGEQQFFIEYLDASMPTRAAIARVEQLSDYADDDEWTETTNSSHPVTIFVVDKPHLQAKIRRYIEDELYNSEVLKAASKGELSRIIEPKESPRLSRSRALL